MAHKRQVAAAAMAEQVLDRSSGARSPTAARTYPSIQERLLGASSGVAEPDNLVLEHLRRIQTELSAGRERDREIIARLGRVEMSVATQRREIGQCEESIAAMNVRLDRVCERIERIERRLEIAD